MTDQARTPHGVSVADLFAAAGLKVPTPLPWESELEERQPGVYVIAAESGALDVSYLPSDDLALWNSGQPIVYIDRTSRPLRRRLSEFYKHRYDDRSPHRGGRAVKLLTCPLLVYGVAAIDHRMVEHRMIEAFKRWVGPSFSAPDC